MVYVLSLLKSSLISPPKCSAEAATIAIAMVVQQHEQPAGKLSSCCFSGARAEIDHDVKIRLASKSLFKYPTPAAKSSEQSQGRKLNYLELCLLVIHS